MPTNIQSKLYELLSMEDQFTDFQNDNNPFRFRFKDNDYNLHFSKIHSYHKRPEMRRIQIDADIKKEFIKYNDYEYVFGIFGYDQDTDTISTWDTSYLNSEFKSGKSLYSTKESLYKAQEEGINKYHNKEHPELFSIHFPSKYLGFYLNLHKECKTTINQSELLFKGFDFFHKEENYYNLEDKITKLHFQLYPDLQKRLSPNWIREEFILVLDLYFKLKEGLIKDSPEDIELLEVFKILRRIASKESLQKRTVGSIYMRIQNFKHVDPEWKGKGLSGGGKITENIFNEFKDDLNKLTKEVKKIKIKYKILPPEENNENIFTLQNIPIVREHEPGNLDFKNLNISIINLDDQIEIQNLKDRASKLHILTVDILASYIRSIDLLPLEDRNSFDLFVEEKKESKIFEIKSLSNNNFVSQLRSAAIQLQEYVFTHQHIHKTDGFNKKIKKYIVFHDNPHKFADELVIKKYFDFCISLNINVFWIENGELKCLLNSNLPW